MNTNAYWFGIVHCETQELLAILKSRSRFYVTTEDFAIHDQVKVPFSHMQISQAEFETYQAFGIREIKL